MVFATTKLTGKPSATNAKKEHATPKVIINKFSF
jgi:hypothetical protein